MCWSFALAAFVAAACASGCTSDELIVEVTADGLEAPGDLDQFCLAVADTNPAGGEFARQYTIGTGGVAGLPQTLVVDPGEAQRAIVWARGYAGGIERAQDVEVIEFGGQDEQVLTLRACAEATAGQVSEMDRIGVPDGAVLAGTLGRTGVELVMASADSGAIVAVRGSSLTTLEHAAPLGPAEGVHRSITFDADGDCDDDALIVGTDGSASVWLRAPDGSFAISEGAIDDAPTSRAVASADVDGDGDIDVALAGATELAIFINDGTGSFTRLASEPQGDGATGIRDLAAGDIDGDGIPDLIAARFDDMNVAALPPRVLLNRGAGVFRTAPGALPDVALDVSAMALRDLDGDGALDWLIARPAAGPSLYMGRGDGRLDNQSFVRLPQVEPFEVASIAVGDLDGDCAIDLAFGPASGGAVRLYMGDGQGAWTDGGDGPIDGEQVALIDVDADGALDLLSISGGTELSWAR